MTDPQIFYLCYDHQKPSGGQKQMYRHVDILNKHGYRAFAMHAQRGFCLNWFAHNTNVICMDDFGEIYDPANDFIVLPEDLGDSILSFPGKKIIFNQGAYLGFYSLGLKKPRIYPYVHPEVKAVIVVSDHNRDYLSFVYPELKIYRVYNGVDPDKYIYQPIDKKSKQIACLPSKNPLDLTQVYHILMSRADQGLSDLSDYEWVFIENMPETDVIDFLRDSLIFIFLSTEEGFGRMPLEAMLSGSLVTAYCGGPLVEYLSADNSFLSKKGDVIGIAKNIENITQSFSSNGDALRIKSQAALSGALEYSLQKEEESVLATWEDILGLL